RDGSDERAARGGLLQDCAGRARNAGKQMTAATLFDYDERIELARWSAAATLVVAAHLALVASYVLLRPFALEGSIEAPVVIMDFAPTPVAPSSDQDIAVRPRLEEAQEGLSPA